MIRSIKRLGVERDRLVKKMAAYRASHTEENGDWRTPSADHKYKCFEAELRDMDREYEQAVNEWETMIGDL